jgi:hypothetical protein
LKTKHQAPFSGYEFAPWPQITVANQAPNSTWCFSPARGLSGESLMLATLKVHHICQHAKPLPFL